MINSSRNSNLLTDIILRSIGFKEESLKTKSIVKVLLEISQVLIPNNNIFDIVKEDLKLIVDRLETYRNSCEDTSIYINIRPENLFPIDYVHIPEWILDRHKQINVYDIENDLPTEEEIYAFTISSNILCKSIYDCVKVYLNEPDLIDYQRTLLEVKYLLGLFYLNHQFNRSVLVVGDDNPLRNVEVFPQTVENKLFGFKFLNRKASSLSTVAYLQNQALQANIVLINTLVGEQGLIIEPTVLSLLSQANGSFTNYKVLIHGEELGDHEKYILDIVDHISQPTGNVEFYIGDMGYHRLLNDLGLEEDSDGDIVTKSSNEDYIKGDKNDL